MLKYHRGERRYRRRQMFQKRLMQNLNHRCLMTDWQKFPLPTIRREVTKEDWEYRNALRRVETARTCSCSLCVSDRRVYGNGRLARTFQEYRFMERLNDEE